MGSFREYVQNTTPYENRMLGALETQIPRFMLWKGQLVPGEVVYAICCPETKRVVYIGVTNRLKRRLAEHRLTGKFDPEDECVFYSFAPRNKEGFLIELLCPERNIKLNPRAGS